MKRTLTTFLTAGIAPVAYAHTLDPAGGIMTALGHELLGLHHLPLTLLLVVVGIGLFRNWKKKAR